MKGYSGCFWKLNDEVMIMNIHFNSVLFLGRKKLKFLEEKQYSLLCPVLFSKGNLWQRRGVSKANRCQFINYIISIAVAVQPSISDWRSPPIGPTNTVIWGLFKMGTFNQYWWMMMTIHIRVLFHHIRQRKRCKTFRNQNVKVKWLPW